MDSAVCWQAWQSVSESGCLKVKERSDRPAFGRSWLCMTASCAPRRSVLPCPNRCFSILAASGRTIHPRGSVLLRPDQFLAIIAVYGHIIHLRGSVLPRPDPSYIRPDRSYPARTGIFRSWPCLIASYTPENHSYTRPDRYLPIMAVYDRVMCPR